MTTRFYTFGGISSPPASGNFTVNGISYTYNAFNGVFDARYGVSANPQYAIDDSTSTSVSLAWGGVNYWEIDFSVALPLNFVSLVYQAAVSGYLVFQAYNGTSWITIANSPAGTNRTASTSLELTTCPSYLKYRVYSYDPVGYTAGTLYNIKFTFKVYTTTLQFDGVSMDDYEDSGNLSITSNSGLDIEDLSNGYISLLDNNGLDVDNDNINYGSVSAVNYQANDSDALDLFNPRQNTNNGSNLEDFSAGLRASVTYGENICSLDFGRRSHIDSGFILEDNTAGIRTRNDLGFAIDDEIAGREVRNVIGNGLCDDIAISSNANNKYFLTVTPTHQHRSMPVTVLFTTRSPNAVAGKYSVTLNGSVIIQPSLSDEELNSVTFTINPSQLAIGLNKARIKLFYPNGSQEYLDFEVVKEEIKRAVAQRLFRDYDGGFDGNGYNPPKILIPDIYPSLFATINSSDCLMKTTDYTRMSLAHYTDIQGVKIVGGGLSILVSFDKGVTWKSFINNVWTDVDISNIATYGMSVNTVNSITIAQWSDTFKPTSIDFAIYIDDNLPTAFYVPPSSQKEVFYKRMTLAKYGTIMYPIQDSHLVTKITHTVEGAINYFFITRWVYSNLYPSGISYRMTSGWGYSYTYTPVANSEKVTKVGCYNDFYDDVVISTTIESIACKAYLKSITVNMTPSPFTGYAFII